MSNIKRERLETPRRIIKREYLDIRHDPQWKDAVERMDRSMEMHSRREIRKARDKIRNYRAQIERLENMILNHEQYLRPDPQTPPRSRREAAERNGWIAPTKGPIKPASPEFIRMLRDLRKPNRRRQALIDLGRLHKPSEDA
jgi:hypothetical protein